MQNADTIISANIFKMFDNLQENQVSSQYMQCVLAKTVEYKSRAEWTLYFQRPEFSVFYYNFCFRTTSIINKLL